MNFTLVVQFCNVRSIRVIFNCYGPAVGITMLIGMLCR